MPALHRLMGGHDHEGVLSSDAALMGTMLIGVFCWRMLRVMGVVLIPTLTACRKLAMHLFCGGKKGGNHGKIDTVRGCWFCLFANALAFSSSCYFIKLSLLCLGTVLTLLR
jgi:hypothetical protein